MIRLLDVKQIFVDKEIYPRTQYGWQTAYDYSESMKAGAVFPPIVVNFYAGKYYLIDGKHRIEAYKTNKVKSVKCIVLNIKSKAEMYKKAIAMNIGNGRALTPQDKAMIICKLRDMKVSMPHISKIIQISVGKIEQFVAKRVTNSVNGEEIYLKAPLTNFAGSDVPADFNEQQKVFASNSQEQIIKQLITLLENNQINTKNNKIMNDLKIVYQLIKKTILGKRKS